MEKNIKNLEFITAASSEGFKLDIPPPYLNSRQFSHFLQAIPGLQITPVREFMRIDFPHQDQNDPHVQLDLQGVSLTYQRTTTLTLSEESSVVLITLYGTYERIHETELLLSNYLPRTPEKETRLN
ncbi:MAG: hypothetical protein WC595_03765 [Candidatus Nanoarchaeia archaeon]